MRRFPMPGALVALTTLVLIAFSGCLPDGLTDVDWKARQPDPLPPAVSRGWVEVGRSADLAVAIAEGPRVGVNRLRVTGADGAPRPFTASAACGDRSMPVDGATVTLLPATPPEGDATAPCRLSIVSGAATLGADLAVRAAPDRAVATSERWIVWEAPDSARVGATRVVLRVLDRASLAPVDGAVTVFPYMDMGGGDGHSTPFQGPFALGDGRHRVDLDFLMSGRWDLTVRVPLGPGRVESGVLRGFVVHER